MKTCCTKVCQKCILTLLKNHPYGLMEYEIRELLKLPKNSRASGSLQILLSKGYVVRKGGRYCAQEVIA